MSLRPFLAVCLLSLSCRPADPPRVWRLSARDLVNSYHDGSGRWTGQRVSVHLPPGGYVVAAGGVHWHPDRTTEPPALVFECAAPPKDDRAALEVTGTCAGKVHDGHRRASGANFYVRVADCVVTAR